MNKFFKTSCAVLLACMMIFGLLPGSLGHRMVKNTYAAGDLTDGLAAHWSFDADMIEDSTIMADVGDTNAGITDTQNISPEPNGAIGGALRKGDTGDSAYIEIPVVKDAEGDVNGNTARDFSMAFWVYRDFETIDEPTGILQGKATWLYLDTNGTIKTRKNALFSGEIGGTELAIPNQKWTHMAIVHDKSEDTVYTYLNGLPVTDNTYTSFGAETDPFRLGRGGNNDNGWQGAFDDFRVYGRVLTEAEVLALYEDKIPPGAVSDLGVVPGDGELTLNWTNPADTDLSKVRILDSDNSVADEVYGVTPGGDSSITLTGLSNGKSYTYRIKTVDATGNVSKGETISGTPDGAADVDPPGDVRETGCLPSDGQLTLSWTNPSDLDFSHVSIYDQTKTVAGTVYGSPDEGKTWNISGLTNGEEYTYILKAVDHAGNESDGVTVAGTPVADSVAGDLVGHWTFDDGTVDFANKVIKGEGSGLEASFVAASPDAVKMLDQGKVGGALQVDSTADDADSYVLIPKNSALGDMSKPFTIAFWIYRDITVPDETGHEIFKPDTSQKSWISMDKNGELRGEKGTFVLKEEHVSIEIKNKEWTHIAIVNEIENTLPRTKIYANGYQVNNPVFKKSNSALVAFRLGSDIGGSKKAWKGAFDDFRLYNRNLSEQELREIIGITDDVPPQEVSDVTVTPADSRLTLGWTPSEDEDYAGVDIYQDDILIKRIRDEAQTSYTVTGLTNDKVYSFMIKAVDKSANISEGKEIEGTPQILPESDARLKSLTLNQGELVPVFDANVTTYGAGVDNDVSTITLTAVPLSPSAVVKVDGAPVAADGSYKVNLKVGVNIIPIVVTAQDKTEKAYTLYINRADPAGTPPFFKTVVGLRWKPPLSGRDQVRGTTPYHGELGDSVALDTVDSLLRKTVYSTIDLTPIRKLTKPGGMELPVEEAKAWKQGQYDDIVTFIELSKKNNVKFFLHARVNSVNEYVTDMVSTINKIKAAGLEDRVKGVMIGEHEKGDPTKFLPLAINIVDQINSGTDDFLKQPGKAVTLHGGRFGAHYTGIEAAVDDMNFIEEISTRCSHFSFALKYFNLGTGKLIPSSGDLSDVNVWKEYINSPAPGLGLTELDRLLDKYAFAYPEHANCIFIGDAADGITFLADNFKGEGLTLIEALKEICAENGWHGFIFEKPFDMIDYIQEGKYRGMWKYDEEKDDLHTQAPYDRWNGWLNTCALPSTLALGEVTGVTAVGRDKRLTVSWTDPADTDFAKVRIYNGSALAAEVNKGVETADITGLSNGVKYTLIVKTVDAEGDESAGVAIEGTPRRSGSGSSSRKRKKQPAPQKDGVIDAQPTLDNASGAARSKVSSGDIKAAFEKAAADDQGAKTIDIVVPKVRGAKRYELTLPASVVLQEDASQKVHIKTETGSLVVPGNMFKEEDIGDGAAVTFALSPADRDVLGEKVKAEVGERPMIDIGLEVNGKARKWESTEAVVKVAIPYTPSEGEHKKYEHITVRYIDEQGEAEPVPSGRYNEETGMVEFEAHHNSIYAVAYVEKTFEDIARYGWAKKEIEVLASKGVINGTTASTYGPGLNITRADFMVLLVRTLGLRAETDETFKDINRSDYYYDAVAIGKKLGIAKGAADGRFNPEDEISRQDMMTLAARAMQLVGKTDTEADTASLERFEDKSDVADYAADSIAIMVEDGIVRGSNGRVNPRANATRAETAVIMYKIYNR
ncbi:MAG: S-layer homology domain-containing protein [Firmicutes bacterium]|nr:S-layer homology domain-containing protein [Bacillota bacterium]